MTDEQRNEIEVLSRLVREGKIDRRRLIQATAAMGVSGAVGGSALSQVRPASAAQRSDKLLATVSNEQQATWQRVFNPLLAQNSARWPTQSGIYEPLAVFNEITRELVP